jgi:hypothetical protein
VATKDHKRYARGLIEQLESRIHVGPPVHRTEILSARQYLLESDFSPTSDYFSRLMQIQHRLETRSNQPAGRVAKRNYGGEGAGRWMQLQCAYDHVILSTCYEGEFNLRQGRIKISHRFNEQGRVDFVELKFLRSLQPVLNGEIRKLLLVKNFPELKKDWLAAEAFVLEVLPRELMFLYDRIFDCERSELFAWLINIGHGLVSDLLADLKTRPMNGSLSRAGRNPDQLCLTAIRNDEIAGPIVEKAALLQSVVEVADPKRVLVRYLGE